MGPRKRSPFWDHFVISFHFLEEWHPFCVPFSGHIFSKKNFFFSKNVYQACATWQWYNSAASKCPPGRSILNINLDETYVSYHQGLRRGIVAVEKHILPTGERPLTQRASRHELRMGLTHVGIICDDVEVQRLLPQVLIVPDNVLRKRDLAEAKALMPPHVYILRRPTKWVSVDVLIWVMRLIQWSLRAVRHKFHIVFLMDVLAQHFADDLVREMAGLAFWCIFIPGRLTWLLQPCDTHAFALFKQRLQLVFLRERAADDGVERHGVFGWLLNITRCIDYVINGRSWALAFKQNGFGGNQLEISSFIRRHLGASPSLPVPPGYPSEIALRLIFPQNRKKLDLGLLTHGCFLPVGPLMLPPVPPVAVVPLLALPPPPLNIHLALSMYSGSAHPRPSPPPRPIAAKTKAKPKAKAKPKPKPKALHIAVVLPPALPALLPPVALPL